MGCGKSKSMKEVLELQEVCLRRWTNLDYKVQERKQKTLKQYNGLKTKKQTKKRCDFKICFFRKRDRL